MSFTRTKQIVAVGLVALGGLSVSACSSNVGGGDTTCGDYLAMGNDDQKQVIKNFMEEKGNSDPSGFEVNLSHQSAKLYCNTAGSESDTIRNIDG